MRDRGTYNITANSDGTVGVVGTSPKASKTLVGEYNTMGEAITAAKHHHNSGKVVKKIIVSGTEAWYKKYPETRPLAPDKTGRRK